jgi:hypothetical protein
MNDKEVKKRIQTIAKKPNGRQHIIRALKYFGVKSVEELYSESGEAFVKLCENPYLPVTKADAEYDEDVDDAEFDEYEDEEVPVTRKKKPSFSKSEDDGVIDETFSRFPDYPTPMNVPDTAFGKDLKRLVPYMFSLGMTEVTLRIENGRVTFRAIEGSDLGLLRDLV